MIQPITDLLVDATGFKNMPKTPFQNPDVEAVFDAYDPVIRNKLLQIRQRIFDVAAQNKSIGALEETLKWGQPSYLTSESKSGTTVRIAPIGSELDTVGLYVNCQTTLATTYRELYSGILDIEGKRCIRIGPGTPVPCNALDHCILLALTYHLNKCKDALPF